MQTPNPKCNRCKCYWKPDETDIKTSGLPCKTCKKCRAKKNKNMNNSKCEHNRQKPQCKDCGGNQICEHNRRKSQCKDCGGSEICVHNRRKSYCKDCDGSQICEHNRDKRQCKDCGGSQICEHNRMKSQCKDCGGSRICEHNRIKSYCKDCEPELYIVNLQRVHIRRCFNNSNLNKTNPSISYLDCDIKYFKEYFQKKMDIFNKYSEIEMTWDNIHIDHIKPVSSFNLDDPEELLDCCHYSNLQPLLAEINLNKSCKWNDKAEEFWRNNIKGKEYLDIYIPV